MSHRPTPQLRDLSRPKQFARELKDAGLGTEHQLRWWLRWRHNNGLMSSGAVVERMLAPGSKKPMLIINKPIFLQWLSGTTERDNAA